MRGTFAGRRAFFAAMPSTVIRAAHYHPDEEALDILFTTGRRYRYHRVPPEAAEAFRAAFSKGRYFNAHIRDRYDFTEVAGDAFQSKLGGASIR